LARTSRFGKRAMRSATQRSTRTRWAGIAHAQAAMENGFHTAAGQAPRTDGGQPITMARPSVLEPEGQGRLAGWSGVSRG